MTDVKHKDILFDVDYNVLYQLLLLNNINFQEEDYPGAINLCLECEKAAQAFKHYSCIRYMYSNTVTLLTLKFTYNP